MGPDGGSNEHPYRSPEAREPLEIFRRGPGAREIALVTYGAPVLIVLAAALLGPVNWLARVTGIGWAGAMVAVAAFGVTASLLWRWKQARITDDVRVYDDGFRITEGARSRFVRWSEVTELRSEVTRLVTQAATMTSEYRLKVTTPSDEVVLVRAFQNVERLGDVVRERVGEALIPALAKRLDEGEKVVWSPLSLRRAGIRHSGEIIPWRSARVRFEPIRSRDGRGVIHEEDDLVIEDERGEVARHRVAQVANAVLLGGIIARMRELGEPRRADG